MMGGAAIPLQLYARRHVPPGRPRSSRCCTSSYAPLHGANLYDFHYLPLGCSSCGSCCTPWRRGGTCSRSWLRARAVRAGGRRVLSRGAGRVLLLTGSAARAGRALATVGVGYFLVMKLGVMPHFGNGDESFVNQYAGLVPPEATASAASSRRSWATRCSPERHLERDKFPSYLFQLFVPVLFVPVARPIGLLLVIPGFVFTLLSTGTRRSARFVPVHVVLDGLRLHRRRARARADGDAAIQADARGPGGSGALAMGRRRGVARVLVAVWRGLPPRRRARGGFEHSQLRLRRTSIPPAAPSSTRSSREIPPDARVSA